MARAGLNRKTALATVSLAAEAADRLSNTQPRQLRLIALERITAEPEPFLAESA